MYKNKSQRINYSIIIFVFFPIWLLNSCASKKIEQLQSSVGTLQRQVQQYKHETAKESAQTTSSLDEVNESISRAFHEIRTSQSRHEKSIQLLLSRLDTLENELSALRNRMERLSANSSDNYQTLTNALNQTRQESELSINQKIQSLQNSLQQLDRKIDTQQSKFVKDINEVQNQLNQKISIIDSSNREVYEKILKELGISSPKQGSLQSQLQGSPTENYSGTIHIVTSNDTLSGIASKYNVDVNQLQELNGISNPSLIRIGQRIKIP